MSKARSGCMWKSVGKMKGLYLIMLIPLAIVIIFNYIPMYGVIIAFKNFRFNQGIMGSQWNNFEHFRTLFTDIFFWRVITNTLKISFFRLTIVFIAPVVLAILINEIVNDKFKRITQTISYLPHFISWVVIGSFVYQLLSPEYGAVNWFISKLGLDPVFFMGKSEYFVPILVIALIWAGAGWGSIIYLAAIANIDSSMYESAQLDGAGRFQRIWYITVPSIMPTITIMFILGVGGVLRAGFDPVFNLYNDLVMDKADIIDTYVFRVGLYNARYDYSTAVGLFQNVVGLIFLLASNAVVKKINDQGIF